MKRNLLFYTVIIFVFATLMWLVLDRGQHLVSQYAQAVGQTGAEDGISDRAKPLVIHRGQSVTEQFIYNIKNPLSLLLLQMIIILVVSRFFGVGARKLRQPLVMGEIIAGIALGPSMLGWFFPDTFGFLFPKESLKNLQFLSQIGLMFFMFIIGMELDISKLRNKAHDAVVISHASIIFPYFLGMLLAYFLYPWFSLPGVSFLSFALFMGIATSITAFPVLARIIQERKLTKTPLGILAITCAAADDVTAWCILAAVIAIVKAGSIVSAWFTIGLAILFVGLMIYVIGPWLEKLGQRHLSKQPISKTMVVAAFFTLLVSAYFAEIIGIHALFGAFIAGVIMPSPAGLKPALTEKLEDISVLLLLPIFFAFTGLRTQIGLLGHSHLWMICGGVIGVAVLGKLGGSTLAARLVGQPWRDALSIGALMNTRGLMELVVLNIGYDLGILSPEIFTMMVIMAIVTTMMTGPLLDIIEKFGGHIALEEAH